MKIFSTEQIYEADRFTINKQNILSDELMERAGNQVFKWLDVRLQGQQVKIHVFCGVGNNGGDGLVIGRHLVESGYNVEVYVVNFSDKRSGDFLKNFDRIKNLKYWPNLITSEEEFPEVSNQDVIIDAIFGIGLNRQPVDWVGAIIQKINNSGAFVLSVDIPSGLYMHAVPDRPDFVVRANHTLTFQSPKLAFFLPQTGVYTQQWEIVDIGLDVEYIMKTDVEAQLINKQEILTMYIPREKFSHKGNYGHALIVGGSYGKIGAALMASEACLNTGAGLVTAFIPKCGYTIFQTAFPEAMVITNEHEERITQITFDIAPTVIGIGVGLGKHQDTVNAFSAFLKENKKPLVIDADGLNILAENKELLPLLPVRSVLTPHPGELERLIGAWKDDFEKLEKAKQFAFKYDIILVIKDAHTITIYNKKLCVNNTGNPGMATGGSGDVLTGMITGLIAQGYDSLTASIFGVYLHGKAGDLAVMKTSYQALTATDIIDFIGDAFLDLFQQEAQPPIADDQEEV